MKHVLFALGLGFWALFFVVSPVQATPTQFGDSGLLSQPVAQTLNEGNICIGMWANCTKDSPAGDGVNVPVALTMGLGTFMEVYGSYPNLLFNGDEEASGRGYANAGFRFRVYGKRSDPFRLGVDIEGRRSVSDEPDLDGMIDYASRLIASMKLDNIGLHANAGYVFNDSPSGNVYETDDQVTLGGGVEYYPINRLRLLAEVSYESEKFKGQDDISEVTVGFQYYLTPHLTMNVGTGFGVLDGSPDWRALFGLSTCQGVGTFNRPVPKLVEPVDLAEELEVKKPLKLSKIKLLTPLIPQAKSFESPVSHLEVPVEEPREEVIVDPGDRLRVPEVAKLDAPAVSPIGAPVAPAKKILPPGPIKTEVYRKFRFPEFTFGFDQYNLSEKGREALSLVAEELRKENRFYIISVEGYTDNVGSNRYNQKLSYERAVTAATHLALKNGVDPARLFVKGFGENDPIDDNGTSAGRARNRRVELLVLLPKMAGQEPTRPAIPVAVGQGTAEKDVLQAPAETVKTASVQPSIKPAGSLSPGSEPASDPVDVSQEKTSPIKLLAE